MSDSPEIQTDTGVFAISQKNLNLPAQGFIRLAIILSLIPIITKAPGGKAAVAGDFPSRSNLARAPQHGALKTFATS